MGKYTPLTFKDKKLEKLHSVICETRDSFVYGKYWRILHNLQGEISKADIYGEDKYFLYAEKIKIARSMNSAEIQQVISDIENAWFFNKESLRDKRNILIKINNLFTQSLDLLVQ